ncbi:hypothetical protein [Allokutzneria sp. A3M-2-11 16]|uniref:hypothetical protein n=1 Tax=Allokutzneria sp. A3M-2-11 16 TaxID=2962043 RepID=UPI0027E38840|nr:hypothetical protein [Allokutzneria sp. A3M-2-11 16]
MGPTSWNPRTGCATAWTPCRSARAGHGPFPCGPQLARRFADGLRARGARIGNEVVLNQVLVRFGGTVWRGRRWMRISVSNWSTAEADVDRSVEAVLHAAARHA